MSTQAKNLAASVHQRLLNLSQQQHDDFNRLLLLFAIERLLYRLSVSDYAHQFVLKGALLFMVWTVPNFRPTRDLDLLGFGDASAAALLHLFQTICQQSVVDDGLTFDPQSVRVNIIRVDQEYQGQRVELIAHLGRARLPLQIDIGFGDLVLPTPVETAYPTLLDFPSPHLRIYSRESVIAEKFHAMTTLALTNSRLKDFYDLWTLSRLFPFDGTILTQAIQATFTRRNTAIPVETPVALTGEFSSNSMKVTQWHAFLKRNQLTVHDRSFAEIVADLAEFLLPPVQALAQSAAFSQHWTAATQWR